MHSANSCGRSLPGPALTSEEQKVVGLTQESFARPRATARKPFDSDQGGTPHELRELARDELHAPAMPELSTSPAASVREKLTVTSLLIAVSAFGFLYVDARNAHSGHGHTLSLETPVDAVIPFVPAFIFIYVLYYPWVIMPLFVVRTRDAFYRALAAFGLAQLIAQIMFVLFPASIERPSMAGQGLTATLVRFIYSVDLGWNLFPSLHVAHSVLVALLFGKYASRKTACWVWLGTLLISASTLLVKQHYLIDVPAGMLLGWLCYSVASSSWQGFSKRVAA